MKPILLATDYSTAARNAADYAAQLAKATNTPLIIFNVWALPIFAGETVAAPIPFDDMESAETKFIQTEAERLEKKWQIKVKAIERPGLAVDEIEKCCDENNISLLIMGMRFADSFERVFGSTVTAFMKRDVFPILVIPEKSKFVLPKKILLATDLQTKAGIHVLDLLKEIASKFSTDIHIVNVINESLQPVDSIAETSGQRLQKLLKNYPHTWHYEETENVVHGIFKSADEISVQWIAVIHHHLGWLKRLNHKSTSRQLTFLSNIPLLILPEKNN